MVLVEKREYCSGMEVEGFMGYKECCREIKVGRESVERQEGFQWNKRRKYG